MNFEEVWQEMMKKKPVKDGQKVILTKEQMKKMCKSYFTKGFFQCYSKFKSGADMQPIKDINLNITLNKLFDQVGDVFKTLFGDDNAKK